MAATDDDLGPEAVEAVRQAAERAGRPSDELIGALVRALDILRRKDAQQREALAIVQAVADGNVMHDSMGGLLIVSNPDDLVTRARALLDREAGQ